MNYPYQLEAYVARLSFRDAFGLEAILACYQRLRVLAPELRDVTHHVWGKGDQFSAYASVPTDAVQVAEANGKSVIISTLRTPAKYGDIVEIHSSRRIHHGFKEKREGWEYMPFTPTENARIAINFPIGKEPQGITVGASRGSKTPFVTRPATKEIVLNIKSPSLGSLYRIDWSW